MIKIFSIKEIIQASTDILNSQNLEKTNTKNTSDGKKKIIPNSDYENIINEKMLSSEPLVLKKEINKSPICDVRLINTVIITKSKILNLVNWFVKIGTKKSENTKEPIAPLIVFFGLIFVSFLPPKVFPTTKPPISVIIEIKIE